MESNSSYVTKIEEAAVFIKENLGTAEIGIVLGSGLHSFSEKLESPKSLDYKDIPHFPVPSVTGHSGKLILGTIGGKKIFCLAGRSHHYEGHSPFVLSFAARVVSMCGVRIYIASNAAGGAVDGMDPGSILLIKNTFNNTNCRPFGEYDCLLSERGYFENQKKIRFSEHLMELSKQVAAELDHHLYEGNYCMESGPIYESALETKGGYGLGVGSFGMSTVPEVEALAALGVHVVAFSLVTNLASWLSSAPLTHEEVKETADRVADEFQEFIGLLISKVEVNSICGTKKPTYEIPEVPVFVNEVSFPQASLEDANLEEAASWLRGLVSDDKENMDLHVRITCLPSSCTDAIPEGYNPEPLHTNMPNYEVSSRFGRETILYHKKGSRNLYLVSRCGLTVAEAEYFFFSSYKAFSGPNTLSFSHIMEGIDVNGPSKDSPYRLNELRDYVHFKDVPPRAGQFSGTSLAKLTRQSSNLENVVYTYIQSPLVPTGFERKLLRSVGVDVAGNHTTNLLAICRDHGVVVDSAHCVTSTNGKTYEIDLSQDKEIIAKVRGILEKPSSSVEERTTNHVTTPVYVNLKKTTEVSQGSKEEVQGFLKYLADKHPSFPFGDMRLCVVVTGDINNFKGFEVMDFLPAEFKLDFEVKLADLPFMDHIPKGKGREPKVVFGRVQGKSMCAISYNFPIVCGLEPSKLNLPLRAIATVMKPGRFLFLTTCASCSDSVSFGDAVIVADSNNLTGENPLRGKNNWGVRFPDTSKNYVYESLCTSFDSVSESKLQRVTAAITLGKLHFSPAEAAQSLAWGCNCVIKDGAYELVSVKHMASESKDKIDIQCAMVAFCDFNHLKRRETAESFPKLFSEENNADFAAFSRLVRSTIGIELK